MERNWITRKCTDRHSVLSLKLFRPRLPYYNDGAKLIWVGQTDRCELGCVRLMWVGMIGQNFKWLACVAQIFTGALNI